MPVSSRMFRPRRLVSHEQQRLGRSLIVGLACLGASLSLGGWAPLSSAAETSLEEIRAALHEQYSSIRTMDVKLTYDFVPDDPETFDPRQMELEWAMDGDKRYYRQDAEADHRSWAINTYDGEWSQLAVLDSLEPRKVRFLNRYRGPEREAIGARAYTMAMGLAFSSMPGNLATFLEDPAVKWKGVEGVDGHPCHHYETGPVPSPSGGEVLWYSLWLDPNVDWLPRRIIRWHHPSCRFYEEIVQRRGHAKSSEWSNHEFRTFDDPLLGRARHLPVVTTLKTSGIATYAVQSLTVNAPIDAERFVIHPTQGTKVSEGEHSNDPKLKRWIHGGASAEAEDRKVRVAAARELSAKVEAAHLEAVARSKGRPIAVDATPQAEGDWWSWMIWSATGCACGLGLWLWKRR